MQDLFRACKTESGKKFSYEDLLKAVRELNPNQKMESICLEDFMKVNKRSWICADFSLFN